MLPIGIFHFIHNIHLIAGGYHARHQFLIEMLEAKVSWLLCIGWLVSKTDNVMHLPRLVKQASADRMCCSWFTWRFYWDRVGRMTKDEVVSHSRLACTEVAPVGSHPRQERHMWTQGTLINFSGVCNYWWLPCNQILAEIRGAKVSCLHCIGSKTDNVMHLACLVKQESLDSECRSGGIIYDAMDSVYIQNRGSLVNLFFS